MTTALTLNWHNNIILLNYAIVSSETALAKLSDMTVDWILKSLQVLTLKQLVSLK